MSLITRLINANHVSYLMYSIYYIWHRLCKMSGLTAVAQYVAILSWDYEFTYLNHGTGERSEGYISFWPADGKKSPWNNGTYLITHRNDCTDNIFDLVTTIKTFLVWVEHSLLMKLSRRGSHPVTKNANPAQFCQP